MSYEKTMQHHIYSVDLLVTGQTDLVFALSTARFIPQKVTIELSALTGSPVTIPVIRIGNNGAYDNICPLFTLTGLTGVGKLVYPTINLTDSIDISSNIIKFDVQTAGALGTVTVMKCNVYLEGFLDW